MVHQLQPLQACQKEFEGQILAACSSPCRSSFQKQPVPHIPLAMAANHLLEHTDSIWTVSIPQRNVNELFRDHRQLAWLLSATTSLLTTRYLLVERNFHYPLGLYISQNVATGMVALALYLWRHSAQGVSHRNEKDERSIKGKLLVAASYSLQALSAFCVVQAVLHTPNLPLLCMIVVGSPSPSQSTSC